MESPRTDNFVFRLTSPNAPTLSFFSDCTTEETCETGYEHERVMQEDEVVFLSIQGALQQEYTFRLEPRRRLIATMDLMMMVMVLWIVKMRRIVGTHRLVRWGHVPIMILLISSIFSPRPRCKIFH